MSALVKENIRQTAATGTGSAVTIADGTATGGATVQPTPTTTPVATDNPLLVRSVIGDETNVADLIPIVAAGYTPADITPGARNPLFTASMLVGPDGTTNTAVRPASVLDGIGTKEVAGDNPMFVRPAARTAAVVAGNDGALQAIAATTAVTVAPSNPDRMFLSIKNTSGTDMSMALGRAAGANDIDLKDGESFTMEAGNGIYTGLVSVYNASAGSLNVHVIEF